MSDLKIFDLSSSPVCEVQGAVVPVEKTTQVIIERNLDIFLGVKFLASEFAIEGGRMDTIGLDETGSPVIIEYKRTKDANVINQGLFYLDWLMGHRGDFEMLVIDRIGQEERESIDWSAPRLICIASDFNKYDEHAIRQMDRNIELIRYRLFDNNLLMLEQLGTASAMPSQTQNTIPTASAISNVVSKKGERTISSDIENVSGLLAEIYEAASDFLNNLGDDVQMRTLKHYVAFRRMRGFAWLKLRPTIPALLIDVRLSVDSFDLEDGFTRDMRKIGHHSPGPVEIRITSIEDLDRAKPLLRQAYERS